MQTPMNPEEAQAVMEPRRSRFATMDQPTRMQAAYAGAGSNKVRAYIVVDADGCYYAPSGKPVFLEHLVPEERAYFEKRTRDGAVIYDEALWAATGRKLGKFHEDVVLVKDAEAFLKTDVNTKDLLPHQLDPLRVALSLVDVIDFYFNAQRPLWLLGGPEALEANVGHIGEVHLFRHQEVSFGGGGKLALLDKLNGQDFHQLVSKPLAVSRRQAPVTQEVWTIFKPVEGDLNGPRDHRGTFGAAVKET